MGVGNDAVELELSVLPLGGGFAYGLTRALPKLAVRPLGDGPRPEDE